MEDKNYEDQKRKHSCNDCSNHQCQTRKVLIEITKYLNFLGGTKLVENLKSYIGSECDVFIHDLDYLDPKNLLRASFQEVNEIIQRELKEEKE